MNDKNRTPAWKNIINNLNKSVERNVEKNVESDYNNKTYAKEGTNKPVVEKKAIQLKINSSGVISISPIFRELSLVLSKHPHEYVQYNVSEKEWTIKPIYYEKIKNELKNNFKFTDIPKGIIKCLAEEDEKSPIDFDLSDSAYSKLLPFQIEGVKQGLSKNGKLLLADEMGLGKTYQALAIAYYYRIEWPLLIVAPASLLENWRNSVTNFLGLESVVIRKKEQFSQGIFSTEDSSYDFDQTNNTDNAQMDLESDDMRILSDHQHKNKSKGKKCEDNNNAIGHNCDDKDCMLGIRKTEKKDAKSSNIVIVSYDIASKYVVNIKNRNFKVIILDECHYIKNNTAKRTINLIPILQNSNRLILLSGTPALSRPIELYTMLTALNKNLFTSMTEYGYRYCNLKKYGQFFDWKGCSNHKELYYFLKKCIMIRRTKDEVLSQLPAKFRRQVILKVAAEKQIKIEKEEIKKFAKLCNENGENIERVNDADEDFSFYTTVKDSVDENITIRYQIAAELKQVAVNEYLKNMLEKDCKFIVFAHHMSMIESIENFLKANTNYIKIDGRTAVVQRQALVDEFQSNESIRVALLGLTACSTGLTLTAAKAVVFAELYWNPGTLLQAEDRVHRIGQKNVVDIHYLTALGTLDEYVWPNLLKKLSTLEKLGIGKNDYKGMSNVPGGQKSIEQYMPKK